MPSTISAADNVAPFLGGHLQQISSLPPRDALDYWDAEKDHMRQVVFANFDLEKMKSDPLAACVVQAFERVWASIPKGRLSGFEDHSKIIGVVYRMASQMHAVRDILAFSGVRDQGLGGMTTPIVFRPRKSDDLPKPGTGDSTPLLQMAVGMANLRLKGGDVDKDAYAKQLRLTAVMRVGLDDRSQHFKTAEGFYAGTPIDYPASKSGVVADVTLAGRDSRIHKSAAGVQAFRLEALGWEDMGYSMPLAIIHDILKQYGDRAIEIADVRESTPLKKA
ncbi:MAG TPA: hypothetical protein PKV72_04125 [Candidatus Peribacteria bacterium]|nr:hypothetical protein [Candidatus Peribacteria bacterium]